MQVSQRKTSLCFKFFEFFTYGDFLHRQSCNHVQIEAKIMANAILLPKIKIAMSLNEQSYNNKHLYVLNGAILPQI